MKIEKNEDYTTITFIHKNFKNDHLPKKVQNDKEEKENERKKKEQSLLNESLDSDDKRYVDHYV